jgi:hypothetical protein
MASPGGYVCAAQKQPAAEAWIDLINLIDGTGCRIHRAAVLMSFREYRSIWLVSVTLLRLARAGF